jgi:hypothetical protein
MSRLPSDEGLEKLLRKEKYILRKMDNNREYILNDLKNAQHTISKSQDLRSEISNRKTRGRSSSKSRNSNEEEKSRGRSSSRGRSPSMSKTRSRSNSIDFMLSSWKQKDLDRMSELAEKNLDKVMKEKQSFEKEYQIHKIEHDRLQKLLDKHKHK